MPESYRAILWERDALKKHKSTIEAELSETQRQFEAVTELADSLRTENEKLWDRLDNIREWCCLDTETEQEGVTRLMAENERLKSGTRGACSLWKEIESLRAESEQRGKMLKWLCTADWSDIQWLYWHSDYSETGDYADFEAGLKQLMERE